MSHFRKAYVEITNHCNLSCSFCHKTNRPKREMSPAEFCRVLEQLHPYTNYLYFHLMGEPLLHPQLEYLMECCEQYGFLVNLTTNGTLVQSVKEILLTAKALRKVSISLHSYEANQPFQPLETYLEQTLSFVQQAQKEGILCELRLWNENSATSNAQNALNQSILQKISEMFSIELEHCPRGKNNSVKLADGVYLGFAQIFDWPDLEYESEQEQLFCYGLRDQIGVLVDGTVVPCCLDSEGTIALGNLYEQPLSEILESPRAKRLYDGFSRRIAEEPLCRRCGYARRF